MKWDIWENTDKAELSLQKETYFYSFLLITKPLESWFQHSLDQKRKPFSNRT